MLSVAQAPNENSKINQEFEDYRKACRERYLQQASLKAPIPEEVIEDATNNASNDSPREEVAESVDDIVNPATLQASEATAPNITSAIEAPAVVTSPVLETLKKSGKTERRNSLSKFISGVFAKKPSSPALTREKKKLTKEEKEKNEQDWRMARFIAELEYEGRSDQEIQMHLFQVRDQTQFARPRSNSVGDWFKSMHQAFKDEFSLRRDGSMSVQVSANPFYAAPPANYMNDIGYSYEDLVALENVPRGVKCLDHLEVLTYEGQELPSSQTTCAVCMMEFEKSEELRGLHCTHHFHKECIDKWLSVGTTCPVCKTEVESDA